MPYSWLADHGLGPNESSLTVRPVVGLTTRCDEREEGGPELPLSLPVSAEVSAARSSPSATSLVLLRTASLGMRRGTPSRSMTVPESARGLSYGNCQRYVSSGSQCFSFLQSALTTSFARFCTYHIAGIQRLRRLRAAAFGLTRRLRGKH